VWRCLRGALRSNSKIESINDTAAAIFTAGRSVFLRCARNCVPRRLPDHAPMHEATVSKMETVQAKAAGARNFTAIL